MLKSIYTQDKKIENQKFIFHLIIGLFIICINYITLSFVVWNLNVSEWGELNRWLYLFETFAFLGLYIGFIFLKRSDQI